MFLNMATRFPWIHWLSSPPLCTRVCFTFFHIWDDEKQGEKASTSSGLFFHCNLPIIAFLIGLTFSSRWDHIVWYSFGTSQMSIQGHGRLLNQVP